MSTMLKILLIVFAVTIVGLVLYFVFFQNKETGSTSNNVMPGSDRDSHGCIGSAGYTWCAAKSKCLRSWEEECN